MGTVYLGRDPNLDRQVAIKVLREALADDELLQRFLREARATANLRHENLVTIYEVDQHDHQPFIAMEYVDGTTLAEVIKGRQQLPLAQKCSFIEQICAGLHHAHRIGIVHRDIKPANVMVDPQGVIRILDFGIARVANSAMTSDGMMLGTLNYMSPEQMLGRPVDFRSDIFSVGALAYELLSYHQAFPGSLDDGLLQRLPQANPARLADLCPDLPEQLEQIVLRALAKHPQDRFADLDEMRVALGRARSSVDPNLQVATVVLPPVNRSKPSTLPESSAARRDLLERRARQIAAHRDAARAALARGDVEAAGAACDDALTLDPDDPQASQLLVEIRQEKERHDQESKAKRERERILRQRVTDAELMFARGDIAVAARLLAQIFTDEPRDPAALILLGKVREAATVTGMILPDVLRATSESAGPDAAPQSTQSVRATSARSRRTPIVAAAAVLLLSVGGVVLWMNRPNEAPSGLGGSSASGASPSASSAGTANPSASGRVDPNAAAAQDKAAASQSNPPVTAAPAAAPPTVADTLSKQLSRITQLNQDGNLAAALAELDRIGPSDDRRVTALARSVAQGAARSMDAALAVAVSQKAAELAPVSFAAAEEARRIADAASNRSDYVHAGRQALAAAEAYRRAESEARVAAAAAAAARTAKPGVPAGSASTAPASPSPTPEAPAPRTETPAATAPSPPAAAIAGAGTLAGERPGIIRALERYQDAYSARSLTALRAVYPSLPQETSQRLDRQFRGCRAYDVNFGNNMTVSLGENDPTAATVTVQTTYLCQPATIQVPPEQRSVRDVFSLRKTNGEWLIMSMADTAR